MAPPQSPGDFDAGKPGEQAAQPRFGASGAGAISRHACWLPETSTVEDRAGAGAHEYAPVRRPAEVVHGTRPAVRDALVAGPVRPQRRSGAGSVMKRIAGEEHAATRSRTLRSLISAAFVASTTLRATICPFAAR